MKKLKVALSVLMLGVCLVNSNTLAATAQGTSVADGDGQYLIINEPGYTQELIFDDLSIGLNGSKPVYQLVGPTMCFDYDGNFYYIVAVPHDTGARQENIRKLTPKGVLTVFAEVSHSTTDIHKVEMDIFGNLYVALSSRIQDGDNIIAKTPLVKISGFTPLAKALAKEYLAGDANGDGRVDLADPIAILNYLFASQPLASLEAGNVNGDVTLNVADAVYLLEYLFSNGPAPVK